MCPGRSSRVGSGRDSVNGISSAWAVATADGGNDVSLSAVRTSSITRTPTPPAANAPMKKATIVSDITLPFTMRRRVGRNRSCVTGWAVSFLRRGVAGPSSKCVRKTAAPRLVCKRREGGEVNPGSSSHTIRASERVRCVGSDSRRNYAQPNRQGQMPRMKRGDRS